MNQDIVVKINQIHSTDEFFEIANLLEGLVVRHRKGTDQFFLSIPQRENLKLLLGPEHRYYKEFDCYRDIFFVNHRNLFTLISKFTCPECKTETIEQKICPNCGEWLWQQ